MKNEKNLLETQSGNLPKELVLKALYSLTDVTDLARAMMANKFLKNLITNAPNLNPMTLTSHVEEILDILKPVSKDIEATNFEQKEKIMLARLLEREIYQRLFTLFKNKTPQEKDEALKSLKNKFSSNIKISYLDLLYADIKAKDRLFLRCAELGLLSPLEQLLKREDIDPAAGHNYAICFASANGHLEVVERLLKDSRVNPAADNNWAIRYASENGHLEVVERLLKDSRVNPAADNNWAIRWASKNGHTEIVKALLNHQLKKQPELSIEELKAQYTSVAFGVDITKDNTFIEAIRELKLERLVQLDSSFLTQYTNTASPVSKKEPQAASSSMPKSDKLILPRFNRSLVNRLEGLITRRNRCRQFIELCPKVVYGDLS